MEKQKAEAVKSIQNDTTQSLNKNIDDMINTWVDFQAKKDNIVNDNLVNDFKLDIDKLKSSFD